jgi:hypothetical protein
VTGRRTFANLDDRLAYLDTSKSDTGHAHAQAVHTHADAATGGTIPAAAPTASAPGDASVTGVAVTVARSDHKHARETQTLTRSVCSATLTLTTSDVLVTGLSDTLPAGTGSAWVTLFADLTGAVGAGVVTATLYVDGVARAGQAVLDEGSARGTVGQQWTVAKTGSPQTLEIRAKKTGVGAATARQDSSTLTVLELT